MTESVKVACIQNRARSDIDASLAEIDGLLDEAAVAGVELACIPEFGTCLSLDDGVLEVGAYPEADHPGLEHLRERADRLGMWLLVGSVAVDTGGDRYRNRSLLLDCSGQVVGRYDKIHLFDVDLPDGEVYRESDVCEPGDEAVVVDTPWGRIGMTICYDVRFPYLYRTLAQAGAAILTVPAAFTRTTGKAHWHALLRARAIETGSFVIAPGQYGAHGEAQTYGHSLIIDPWGAVVAEAGEEAAMVTATLDLAEVAEARGRIPALTHDRRYSLPRRLAAVQA